MKSYVVWGLYHWLQYEIFCISTTVQMVLIDSFPCNNQQFYIVDSDMWLNDTNRMHCHVFKASLCNTFVLFTLTHIAQQSTGENSALLTATIFTLTCHSVRLMCTVPNKNGKENKTYISAQYLFSFPPNIYAIINEMWLWDKQEKEICL
jgi:hypothetical protein